MGTEQIYADAVRILRGCGLNAAAADTGGGTLCITVSEADAALDEPRFTFGAAGGTWAAEVAGDPSGLWTDVRSDEDNPTQVARGILAAIARFSQNQS